MRTVSSFLRYGAFLSLPHGFGIHHYFIRYAAVSWVVYLGFTNGEYHIVCVDFIGSSRGQIRKLRFAWVVCIVFSNIEYHIAYVDFIGSSRGRLERDRGFSIPYPSPTPLLTLGGYPLRRENVGCRGGQGYRIPVSGADCLPPLRRGDWGNCVRSWTVRVSVDFGRHMSFVFHYW